MLGYICFLKDLGWKFIQLLKVVETLICFVVLKTKDWILECQRKIPSCVLIFFFLFLWASSINLLNFHVSLVEIWGTLFMTLLLFLKYFVTLCGIASLGSLKTIWIFGKGVYKSFIILKLICALYLCLSVSVVLCEFAYALIWISLQLAVLGTHLNKTQVLLRWEILCEHMYITICVDSQLLLLLAEWKVMRKCLSHQCYLIVNKELFSSLCSCSLSISLYKGIEKVFMNE